MQVSLLLFVWGS